jgi:2-methylcitrate dehydratase PrpD
MSRNYSRRWILGATGAAVLSSAIDIKAAVAQTAAAPGSGPGASGVSTATSTLAQYIAGTLDRALPADVVANAKLHILDTLAATISGSRLKPGLLGARYVDSLGGKPQATVVGTKIVTSVVNAAFANGMSAHADETDDTNPVGPFHAGCGAIPSALAAGEFAGRTGSDLLRAVTLGYDVGERFVSSLGLSDFTHRVNSATASTTFVAAAAAAAMLRLDERQVRHVLAYATQQASGTAIWKRDVEHVEKAFDFAAMGARNGVMAATMVAMGFTGVEDAFVGGDNFFVALGETPVPAKLTAELGTRYALFNTSIKKWTVGSPLEAVLDSTSALLPQPGVRADNIAQIVVTMPTNTLSIVDNAKIPDLSVQHLVALMIVDRGVTFASVNDEARMSDPKVLAVRKLVQLAPSDELVAALPPRQATVRIDTVDGHTYINHTTAVRGTPGNPMIAKEVEDKARDLIGTVLGAGRAEGIIAAISGLESFGPLSGLRRLLQA